MFCIGVCGVGGWGRTLGFRIKRGEGRIELRKSSKTVHKWNFFDILKPF